MTCLPRTHTPPPANFPLTSHWPGLCHPHKLQGRLRNQVPSSPSRLTASSFLRIGLFSYCVCAYVFLVQGTIGCLRQGVWDNKKAQKKSVGLNTSSVIYWFCNLKTTLLSFSCQVKGRTKYLPCRAVVWVKYGSSGQFLVLKRYPQMVTILLWRAVFCLMGIW